MVIRESVWDVCLYISCTGDEDQVGSSFLSNGLGGWGGQDTCRKSYQSNVPVLLQNLWQYCVGIQFVALSGGLVTFRTASCVIGTSACVEQLAFCRALDIIQARRPLEHDSTGQEWKMWENVNVVL